MFYKKEKKKKKEEKTNKKRITVSVQKFKFNHLLIFKSVFLKFKNIYFHIIFKLTSFSFGCGILQLSLQMGKTP